MPEMDGLEATRRILASQPGGGCRIIMLTALDLDQYGYAALAPQQAAAARPVQAVVLACETGLVGPGQN